MKRSKPPIDEAAIGPKEFLAALWNVIKISVSISKSSIFFKAFNAILNSVMPLLTAFFAAQTTTNLAAAFTGTPGAREKVLFFVIATALLGLATAGLASLSSYIDQIVRFKIESRISDMLYEHFVQLDFWRYDDKKTNDLFEKSQSFINFFAYVLDRAARLFEHLVGMIAALVGLAFISPWLSLALVLAIAPGLVLEYKMSRLQIGHWRKHVTERRKMRYIEYNIIQPNTISELRLYNLAKKMLTLRKMYRDKDQGGRLEFERRFIKWRFLGDMLQSLVQLGSLMWIVVRISERIYPIGQFIFVQQLVGRALGSANSLVSEIGSADEDFAKLYEYNEFMSIPKTKTGTKKLGNIVESIRFENVSFSYPSTAKKVLNGISLEIKAGDHVAIVGENGAGKTSFIKLLLGFYRPTSGQIYINNALLSDMNLSEWHKKTGVLLQDFGKYIFATIGENITFGDIDRKPTKQRIETAMEAAEATQMIGELPHGLDTPAATWFEEDEGIQLSGGQWQRTALARNFFRQAPVVILDEPTSAIDANAEANIFDRLFDKSNKNTVITISHRLTTIENADIIYVFKNGKIVQQGVHSELSKDINGEYFKMFRRQIKK